MMLTPSCGAQNNSVSADHTAQLPCNNSACFEGFTAADIYILCLPTCAFLTG